MRINIINIISHIYIYERHEKDYIYETEIILILYSIDFFPENPNRYNMYKNKIFIFDDIKIVNCLK